MLNITFLKIFNIFAIFFAGFFGTTLILTIQKHQEYLNIDDNLFLMLKLFSAGIILGTGCIHMLPESRNMFFEQGYNYPYSDLIFGISIISMMLFEEIINKCFYMSKNTTENNNLINTDNSHYHNYSSIDVESENHKSGKHCHTVNVVYQYDPSLKKLITLYILEFGMSIHSIIIGVTFGTSTDYNILLSLAIAINLHQVCEGVALAFSITQCIENLTKIKIFLITLCYSLTAPIGILIGILITSDTSIILQAIFNAISAGILIYIALIHFIIEDYINNDVTFKKKFFMFLAITFGFSLMAIIGIWS